MIPFSIPSQQRPWRLAWLVSVGLHLAVAGTILAGVLLAPLPAEPVASPLQVDGRWSAAVAEVPSSQIDERWDDVVDTSKTQTVLPDSSASDLSSFVQRQIDRSVADGQRRPPKENEDRLARLSRRLSETSKPEHIDEMADFLGGLLGPRRTEPDPETPISDVDRPPFDVDTAQFHRVRKEVDAAGKTHYIATMIDAKGVTIELELDAETGPQLYKVMKIIESNPLLERVYRKIVMGFLDQALGKKTAE